MEELAVFYFSKQNLQSLPSSLKFLKKLRNLHLDHCKVKDISIVGELESLEILRVLCCDYIEELPADIGRLKFLRLLELKYCRSLKRIVAGVISSLVGLEELKIDDCFHRWEGNGNLSEERNARLSEIESLRNLTSLEIVISDANLFAEEIYLNWQQLERYQIRYKVISGSSFFGYDDIKHERTIELYLRRRDLKVGNWIRQLVKRTQSLALAGDDYPTVEDEFECEFSVLGLEEIFDCRIPEGSNFFQHLESLRVSELPWLGYLWKSQNQNVKHIDIYGCTSLRYLFPMAVIQSLVQIQTLRIRSCDSIEQVFWNEMESNTEASIIEFPKLEILSLEDLPELAAFTQGVEIIKSPLLTEIEISKCPKFRTRIGIEFSNDNGSSRCMIQKLCVSGSDTIEEIFWNETQDDHRGKRQIIFQELYELELRDLPCLTTLYRGTVESIRFPKLRRMRIGNLERMESCAPIDSEHTHDQDALHFFCNQKVEIDGLEDLSLFAFPDRISQMWCRHIPTSLFHNLKKLYIYNIGGIRNSISSSIARALVNLNWLRIQYCIQLVDVIEDETHAPLNSVFPSLKYLHFAFNFKLRSFCQWKHAFELPSLEEVEIFHCPLMETFTRRSLSTPKLHLFVINGRNSKMTDLNGGIHQFIAKIANEDEDMDEHNDDEKHEYSTEDENEIESEV